MALTIDRDAIAELCRQHGVRRLRVFGSALTDQFDPVTSDVDFVVEFEPVAEPGIDQYFDLLQALEKHFDRPVDLVEASAIENPYFAETIARSAEDVYAA
ncbi:nucleotidyltransferase family protein [Nocardioides speluncae]|uniref:nucleotidyltransferase family protein n=1 Tax=Nocardioides speluncae TaxID=2670337 RepID=UPI000D69657A|nr:nucleotidyltransferase domain-containing protein [Nocardioides speluncae]